jgi:hypothetical protein
MGVAAMLLTLSSVGCTMAAKTGAQMVGDTVMTDEVKKYSAQLVGQPAAAADQVFGVPMQTLVNVQNNNQLRLYPVKDDVLKALVWAVASSPTGTILEVSMINTDPVSSKNLVTKLALESSYKGQTATQIEAGDYCKKRVMQFLSKTDGETIRVYDVTDFTNFMGARYCAIRFDRNGIFKSVKIFGLLKATQGA